MSSYSPESGESASEVASRPAEQLLNALSRPGMLVVPGAYDMLSALLVAKTGFEAVYVGGYGIATTAFGLPDSGLVSVPELIDRIRPISRRLTIPVVADLDDGGGSPLLIHRHVRMAVEAGVAAVHIEDMDASSGKHLTGEGLRALSLERATENLRAAVDARTPGEMLVIARTDVLATGGELKDVIERAQAYEQAGADLIFISYLSVADIRTVVSELSVPLVNTYMPNSPPNQVEDAQARGLKMMLHSSSGFRYAFAAIKELLETLRTKHQDLSDNGWSAVRTQIDETIDAGQWLQQLKGGSE